MRIPGESHTGLGQIAVKPVLSHTEEASTGVKQRTYGDELLQHGSTGTVVSRQAYQVVRGIRAKKVSVEVGSSAGSLTARRAAGEDAGQQHKEDSLQGQAPSATESTVIFNAKRNGTSKTTADAAGEKQTGVS